MGAHTRHIPQRTCVGCRQVLPKRTLTRVVRTSEGIKIDLSGKLAGRGAYLHNQLSCWEQGLKGSLSHALKVQLSEQDIQVLNDYMTKIKNENSQE